jgi:hypothetical protein
MKPTVLSGIALIFALSAAAPLFAATKPVSSPEAMCRQQAAQQHIAKNKLNAYVKSCLARQHTGATGAR